MPAILSIILSLAVLFFLAWFCFWLIDRCAWPAAPPAFPLKLILQVFVLLVFLCIVLGQFGVFAGYGWHPFLFGR